MCVQPVFSCCRATLFLAVKDFLPNVFKGRFDWDDCEKIMLSSSSPASASLFAGTTGLFELRFVPGTRRRVGFLVGRPPRPDLSLSLSLSLSSSLESGARLSSCSWSSAVACGFPLTCRNSGGAFLLRPTIILHLAQPLFDDNRTWSQLLAVPRHDALRGKRDAKPLCSIRGNPSRSSLICTFLEPTRGQNIFS